MAQFAPLAAVPAAAVATGNAAMAAGQAAVKVAQVAKAVTISAEKSVSAGFDLGTELLKKSRPEDMAKAIPQKLTEAAGSGDGLVANTLRVAASYERFHYQLLDRLHPTDNLIDGKAKQTLNLFIKLTDEVKRYFCNFFAKLFAESGEQLKDLIIKTVQKMSKQTIIIKDYLEPGIKSVIFQMLSDERTKEKIVNIFRGDCLESVIEKDTPITIMKGGKGTISTAFNKLKSTTPIVTSMSNKVSSVADKVKNFTVPIANSATSALNSVTNAVASKPQGPPGVPLLEISYLDTPDRLKSFICDSFQRMFTDRIVSIKSLILTNLETLIQKSEELKKKNRELTIKIIDEIFDSPKTKYEFLLHLSGGCAIPRNPDSYIFQERAVSKEEQKKRELQAERNPLFLLDKLKDRQFPVTKGGGGGCGNAYSEGRRRSPEEYGNSHTFKHQKVSNARITYRKY
uniref:Uncharacterized protein n=1 Tax=viral metagenome TaxID=1070528 RepID=A0A6C0HVG4_9ZZZZ